MAVTPPSPPSAASRRSPHAARANRIYLALPQVVERYAGVWSRWQIYEHVRTGKLPHRKLPGRRELLFPLDELEAYEDGAALETLKLPDGGRVCRPVS